MALKVVYLFGAGATQAVLRSSTSLSLLTADIQTKIEGQYSSRGFNNKVWSELTTTGNDVEHLISVLETQHNYYASEKIRKYYRDAIVDISNPISISPPLKNLYSVLIDLHNIKDLGEELQCLMTLNYEDILENTIKKIFKLPIDYCLHPNKNISLKDPVKILKLHGSFSWQNTRPISVRKMKSISSANTLWIPPGVDKKKDNYPFNYLWGQAVENLLECDILRVVGCSLSRNDWALIPILYTVQKFNESGKVLDIEIIDFPATAEKIIDNYRYIKFKKITELPEFIGFYKKLFPAASTADVITEINNKFIDKAKANPFYEWLDSKLDYLYDDKLIDISTPKKIAYNFYHKI